jgi:DNA-binding transcriptional MerR regulator
MTKIEDFFKETAFEGLQLNEVKKLLESCISNEVFNAQEFESMIDQKIESLGQEATQQFK